MAKLSARRNLQSSGSRLESCYGHLLDYFVLGFPESKSLAMLVVNSQVVASCQLGFLTLVCCI